MYGERFGARFDCGAPQIPPLTPEQLDLALHDIEHQLLHSIRVIGNGGKNYMLTDKLD